MINEKCFSHTILLTYRIKKLLSFLLFFSSFCAVMPKHFGLMDDSLNYSTDQLTGAWVIES